MLKNNTKIIITDTSVLINFLNVNRVELLSKLAGSFLITEHVVSEITQHYLEQYERLKNAIGCGLLEVVSVDQPNELEMFEELSREGRLGTGECSAIACAINRQYILAIDDVQARKQAMKLAPTLQILTTQDILLELIANRIITVANANIIKNELEHKYRFNMKIGSFEEFVI